MFFKMAQQLTNCSAFFCKRICHQELSKIAQSGHTKLFFISRKQPTRSRWCKMMMMVAKGAARNGLICKKDLNKEWNNDWPLAQLTERVNEKERELVWKSVCVCVRERERERERESWCVSIRIDLCEKQIERERDLYERKLVWKECVCDRERETRVCVWYRGCIWWIDSCEKTHTYRERWETC